MISCQETAVRERERQQSRIEVRGIGVGIRTRPSKQLLPVRRDIAAKTSNERLTKYKMSHAQTLSILIILL